jgi:stress response protein YsnF
MRETYVAIFQSFSAAEAGKRDLLAAGFPTADISIHQEMPESPPEHHQGGFFAWLFGDDTDYYQSQMASGRVVLSLTADPSDYDRVASILGGHDLVVHSEQGGNVTDEVGGAARGQTQTPAGQTIETVIPTAREELQVGKRQVQDTQAFRVRRYTVERPVEQEVTLRDETVTIERRTPVTSATAPSTDQSFEDKTVEVTRTREEPVVAKTVVKGDDVVVKKETTERKETVRDTVRETKVETGKGEKIPG